MSNEIETQDFIYLGRVRYGDRFGEPCILCVTFDNEGYRKRFGLIRKPSASTAFPYPHKVNDSLTMDDAMFAHTFLTADQIDFDVEKAIHDHLDAHCVWFAEKQMDFEGVLAQSVHRTFDGAMKIAEQYHSEFDADEHYMSASVFPVLLKE